MGQTVCHLDGHVIFTMAYGADEQAAEAVWLSVADDNLADLSVWRMRSRDRSRWYNVVCVSEKVDARAVIDFRGGVEEPMTEEQALAFLNERLDFSFEGLPPDKREIRQVLRHGRVGLQGRRIDEVERR
jgi:ribosomal protein S4